jgi:hypothetical protein
MIWMLVIMDQAADMLPVEKSAAVLAVTAVLAPA